MSIVHQNKDVIFKALGILFPETMNLVIGGTEEIKRQLPTQFPFITAKQWQADMIYETINGNIVLLEYESDFRLTTIQKYMHYCLQLTLRYPRKSISMFVFHTGNQKKRKFIHELANLAIKYKSIHLSDIDSKKVFEDAKRAITLGKDLSDLEEFLFTIYPLLDYKNRVTNLEKGLALLEEMTNITQKNRILGGMITASDKFIRKDQMTKIKEKIDMTKFEEIVYEEAREKLEGAYEEKITKLEKIAMKNKQQAMKNERKAMKEKKAHKKLIKMLIKNGVSPELIKNAEQSL